MDNLNIDIESRNPGYYVNVRIESDGKAINQERAYDDLLRLVKKIKGPLMAMVERNPDVSNKP